MFVSQRSVEWDGIAVNGSDDSDLIFFGSCISWTDDNFVTDIPVSWVGHIDGGISNWGNFGQFGPYIVDGFTVELEGTCDS